MRALSPFLLLCVAPLLSATSAMAAVVGVNPPAQPLTAQRIAALPAAQRAAWERYLERSVRQLRIGKQQFLAELRKAGAAKPLDRIPLPAPHGRDASSIPLNQNAAWYSGPQALHIGDVVLSFQTPAGGWSKNLDMSKDPRQPGESYAYGADQTARMVIPGDFGKAEDPGWSFVGTIDNNATTTQLHFLAKVGSAAGPQAGAKYRAGFLRGLSYLFAAQYPNGGWPQVWPLAGGYHDGVTYNDGAMIHVIELLTGVAQGQAEFAFVPAAVRAQAQASVARGVRCVLATQIRVGGKLTAWAQQYDPLTLKPASARNYEMPALSASESSGILLYLMGIPHPTMQEAAAIRGAAAWFKKTAIFGQAYRQTPDGRELMPESGAGPIWARFYQIGTDRPLFGDRDQTIHDRVSEISRERRNGYAWFNADEEKAVERFSQWSVAHTQPTRRAEAIAPRAFSPLP